MAIPSYEELMLPVLQTLKARGKLHTAQCADIIAGNLGLTQEERTRLLPSGRQRYIHNRTGWAAWYMMQAGLISRPQKGWIEITTEGQKLLAEKPKKLDRKVLMKYPSFAEKIKKASEKNDSSGEEVESSSKQTPMKEWKQHSQNFAQV